MLHEPLLPSPPERSVPSELFARSSALMTSSKSLSSVSFVVSIVNLNCVFQIGTFVNESSSVPSAFLTFSPLILTVQEAFLKFISSIEPETVIVPLK